MEEDQPDLELVAIDVETVEIQETAPGWCAFGIRTDDGRLIRIEFGAKALGELEAMVQEVQRKMAEDQGLQ